MSEEIFNIRKHLEELNKILKDSGVKIPDLDSNPSYRTCECGNSWFIPLVMIPEGELKNFAYNLKQKYMCFECKKILEFKL